MNKLIAVVFSVALFNTVAQAQSLKLDELILLQKNGLDYIDNHLSRKNWELHETSLDNYNYYGDFFASYNSVTWSFNKNKSNDKAEAWFWLYQYEGFDNAITYQIHNKERFNQLKTEVKNLPAYKLQKTEAVEQGLESKYRDNRREIIFKQYFQDDKTRYSDVPVYYLVTIYNYKEIEEQKRLREEQARREYEEQIRIEREEQIKEEQYQDALENAETFFKMKKYHKVIEEYQTALKIKPEESAYLNEQMIKINKILLFLNERKYKIYDYHNFEESDYNTRNQNIETNIKTILFKKQSLNRTNITIICMVDSFGITTTSFTSTVSDVQLNEQLKQLSNNIRLNPVIINDYYVNAKAKFEYSIEADQAIMKVKKNAKGLYSKNSKYHTYKSGVSKILSSAPIGKYTLQLKKVMINNTDYFDNKMIKYSRTGGPSNMFLSLVVPGLGVKNVTGGEKNGLSTALWTYGLIGTGVGCKLWSNSEYKKYHSATEQTLMDKHYGKANILNQAFYVCAGTGAFIWLYDIIWVANKGFQNKKEQKDYKRSHFSFYYQPEFETIGLTCSINF